MRNRNENQRKLNKVLAAFGFCKPYSFSFGAVEVRTVNEISDTFLEIRVSHHSWFQEGKSVEENLI